MDNHFSKDTLCPGCKESVAKTDPDAIVVKIDYEDAEHVCEAVSLYHGECVRRMGDEKVKEKGTEMIQRAIAMTHFTGTAPAHNPETLN